MAFRVTKYHQISTMVMTPEEKTFRRHRQLLPFGGEAMRLAFAYEYDPYFSLSVARVDPLPHKLASSILVIFRWFFKLWVPNKLMKDSTHMQIVDKLMMFSMAVSDMPKAKAFYADTLGLIVTKDYRQDDENWWVWLTLPEGGVTIILATYHEHIKPGTVGVYFATSDITEAHKELSKKGAKVSDIQDDLYGPGSGVKFFNLEDPDGAQVLLVQG